MQGAIHLILNARIDRQFDIPTILRRIDFANIINVAPHPVLHDTTATRASGKLIIEGEFDALLAFIIEVIQANNIARYRTFRIETTIIRVQTNPGDTKLFNFLGNVDRHLTFEIDKVSLLVRDSLSQICQRRLQQIRKTLHLGDRRLTMLTRLESDRISRDTRGQHHVVTIENFSTTGMQGQRVLITLFTLLLQKLSRNPLQVNGTSGQHHKTQTKQNQQQTPAPHRVAHLKHRVFKEGHAFHRTPPEAPDRDAP